MLAPEAVAGFAAIGMRGCADVVAEAMRCLGEPYPRERDARNRALDALGKRRRGRDPFESSTAASSRSSRAKPAASPSPPIATPTRR